MKGNVKYLLTCMICFLALIGLGSLAHASQEQTASTSGQQTTTTNTSASGGQYIDTAGGSVQGAGLVSEGAGGASDFPLKLSYHTATIHYDYTIPDDAENARVKQRVMQTEEYKQEAKQKGEDKAEKDLDKELQDEVNYLKEKNKQGGEPFTVVEAGDHSAWWSNWAYNTDNYGNCLIGENDKINPVNMFFWGMGDLGSTWNRLVGNGWGPTSVAGDLCAWTGQGSGDNPPNLNLITTDPNLRRQEAQMADSSPYSRDHVRLWQGRFSSCYNCTPEGQWSIGSVHRETAQWEWQWHWPVDHCLDSNGFYNGQYSIWNNTLGYLAHWFFTGNNGGYYPSCGNQIYSNGIDVSIAVRPYWLVPGQWLAPYLTAGGMARYSVDGRFQFIYQSNGQMVLYQAGVGAIWWTVGNPSPGVAEMQSDGNFVLYDSSYRPYWASGTDGFSNDYLKVQDDGNVVIYNANDGGALWATGTCCR